MKSSFRFFTHGVIAALLSTAGTLSAANITILSQPKNQKMTVGTTATFAVSANGATGSLSYQWYWRPPHGSYRALPGATAASYSTPTLTMGDNDSGCFVRITSGSATLESYHASLSVVPAVAITTQPGNANRMVGTSATFYAAATANPGPVAYQWYQRSKGGVYSAIPGAIDFAYRTPSLTLADDGSGYFVRASSGATTVESYHATLHVDPYVSITDQPDTILGGIPVGSKATFSVSAIANPGPLSYQWYSRLKGGTYLAIPGATSSAYTTPDLTDQDNDSGYFVRVTSGSTTVESDHATLYMNPFVAITRQPGNVGGARVGSTATFSVTAKVNPGPASYQWYARPKGGKYVAIPGATANSYTTPALTLQDDESGYFVRVSCGTATVESYHATLFGVWAPPIRTWGIPIQISPVPADANTSPVLMEDRRDNAMVIWSERVGQGGNGVGQVRTWTSYRPEGGAWTPAAVLYETAPTPCSRIPGEHRLTYDSQGNFWAVWSYLDGYGHVDKGSVQVAQFSKASQTWSVVKSIPCPGMQANEAGTSQSSALSLCTTYEGDSVASWVSKPQDSQGTPFWIATFNTVDGFLPVESSTLPNPPPPSGILVGMKGGMEPVSLTPYILLVYGTGTNATADTAGFLTWTRSVGWSAPQALPSETVNGTLTANDLGRVGFIGMACEATPRIWRKEYASLSGWSDFPSQDIASSKVIPDSVHSVMNDSLRCYMAWHTQEDAGQATRTVAMTPQGVFGPVNILTPARPIDRLLMSEYGDVPMLLEQDSDNSTPITARVFSDAGWSEPQSTNVSSADLKRTSTAIQMLGDVMLVYSNPTGIWMVEYTFH